LVLILILHANKPNIHQNGPKILGVKLVILTYSIPIIPSMANSQRSRTIIRLALPCEICYSLEIYSSSSSFMDGSMASKFDPKLGPQWKVAQHWFLESITL
jgi:hypothetical protein